jgi:hypothetical protein
VLPFGPAHRAMSRRGFYRQVAFRDDTFTLAPDEQLFESMPRYSEEIRRLFLCVSRVDLLDDRVMDWLVLVMVVLAFEMRRRGLLWGRVKTLPGYTADVLKRTHG